MVGISEMGLKTTMLSMTTKLNNNIDNISEKWNNIIQMEILGLKKYITEIKNLEDGFNSKLCTDKKN